MSIHLNQNNLNNLNNLLLDSSQRYVRYVVRDQGIQHWLVVISFAIYAVKRLITVQYVESSFNIVSYYINKLYIRISIACNIYTIFVSNFLSLLITFHFIVVLLLQNYNVLFCLMLNIEVLLYVVKRMRDRSIDHWHT